MKPINQKAALGVGSPRGCGVRRGRGARRSASTPRSEDHDHRRGLLQHPGPDRGPGRLQQAFEAAHPGVTVKRQYVPFAEPGHEAADAGSRPGPAEPAGRRQPVRLDDDLDRPGRADQRSVGLQHQAGYYPAVINEGLSNDKYYSLPVAGANSIALIYNIAMFKAAHLTPPKTWAQLVVRRQGTDDLGSLRDRIDL